MFLLDTNVVLALAFAHHPAHAAATAWHDDAATTGLPVAVPDVVALGFVRISTNRSAITPPLTASQAFDYLRALGEQPHHLAFVTPPDVLSHFERAALDVNATGGLVTDAYIAALAMAYGASVVSFDSDFRRFNGLRLVELVATA
ncbi:type II toxin-antitoxin system VapC family toxin [Nocardioides hungaricus]|jgi:toxin-antitoxin system PIN domain toxin